MAAPRRPQDLFTITHSPGLWTVTPHEGMYVATRTHCRTSAKKRQHRRFCLTCTTTKGSHPSPPRGAGPAQRRVLLYPAPLAMTRLLGARSSRYQGMRAGVPIACGSARRYVHTYRGLVNKPPGRRPKRPSRLGVYDDRSGSHAQHSPPQGRRATPALLLRDERVLPALLGLLIQPDDRALAGVCELRLHGALLRFIHSAHVLALLRDRPLVAVFGV